MLTYFKGDERPAWVATITVNGVADDMSSGYTFEAKLVNSAGTAVTTKSTGITGGAGGVVTVAWAGNDLNITEGLYTAQLKASRTSDFAEWTITEAVQILARA